MWLLLLAGDFFWRFLLSRNYTCAEKSVKIGKNRPSEGPSKGLVRARALGCLTSTGTVGRSRRSRDPRRCMHGGGSAPEAALRATREHLRAQGLKTVMRPSLEESNRLRQNGLKVDSRWDPWGAMIRNDPQSSCNKTRRALLENVELGTSILTSLRSPREWKNRTRLDEHYFFYYLIPPEDIIWKKNM